MKVNYFKFETVVKASLERVLVFHNDSYALKLLTPPPIIITFDRVDPISENSESQFTMWFGPIPIRWVAVHKNVILPNTFTDVQKKGPFKYWEHKHTFQWLNENSTMIIDEIFYKPGSGIFYGLISRFMGYSLPMLFTFRGWVIRRNLKDS